ncbi:MAG: hypothetical protein CR975_01640 [Gammaproteobacteria bacterium]|nr:MAG: hypothetical protein CR975_01640 [Gammaproteobacteria bacterium]
MYNVFASINTLFAGTGMLFLSLYLMLLGNGLQGSLLGIRGADEGFTTMALSLISMGFYAGYFIGTILVPILLKRVGYIRVFAALVAIASVAAVAYAMFIDKYSWFVMRVLTGFCFSGIYMITESWLNSQTHNDNRAKVLGIYVIVIFAGLSTGQLLLNTGSIDGYFLFALASVIISLASIPLLLTTRPAPHIEESSTHLSIYQLYKHSPFGVVSSFFANFLNGGIVGMAAIYAKTINMPTNEIALFVASAFVGVIILQFPLGYLSDRMDRRKVIVAISLLSLIVATMAMVSENSIQVTLLFMLLGGLALPMYAICIAYVNDRLQPEEILPATTALLKIAGVGNVVAPILIGAIMVRLGDKWFFGSLAVAAAMIVAFGVYRIIKGADVIVEEQGEYSPMGVSTTAATLSLTHEGIQMEFDFGEEHRKPVTTEEKQEIR